MTCQIAIDKLMCRAFSKELDQQLKLIKVLDLGQITDILSENSQDHSTMHIIIAKIALRFGAPYCLVID